MTKGQKFQYKLWSVVNQCRTDAVKWSKTGDSIIFNFYKFKKEYLDPNDHFCKSNNISSFIRQLNLYGFKKMVDLTRISEATGGKKEYANANFKKGQPHLLHLVTRNHVAPNEPLTLCIKKEVHSDDKNLKENIQCYIPKQKTRSKIKLNGKFSNYDGLCELRRSSRKRKAIKVYSPDAEDSADEGGLVNIEDLDHECFSIETDQRMMECRTKYRSPLKETTNYDAVGLKIKKEILEKVKNNVVRPLSFKRQPYKNVALDTEEDNWVGLKNRNRKETSEELTDSVVEPFSFECQPNRNVALDTEEDNLWYTDGYIVRTTPLPDYDPSAWKPNPHYERMAKVCEDLGIVFPESRTELHESHNSFICPTLKMIDPKGPITDFVWKLISQDYGDYDPIWIRPVAKDLVLPSVTSLHKTREHQKRVCCACLCTQ